MCTVSNLSYTHTLAPFTPCSYLQARNFQTAVGLVYVAEPGYILGSAAVPKHAILTSLDNKPTPTLDDFARVYATLKEGSRVPLQYYVHTERHRTKTALLHLQTKWYPPAVFYDRNATTGRWDRTTLEMTPPPPPPPSPPLPPSESAAKRRKVNEEGDVAAQNGDETTVAAAVAETSEAEMSDANAASPPESNGGDSGGSDGTKAEAVAVKVEASLCLVQVDIATVALADGVYTRSFEGNGAIIHHDPHGDGLGLVLVDRNTVPVASCDILISFAAYPHEATGRVEYLHPTHNFALVSYDAAALPAAAATAIRGIEMISPDSPPLSRGDQVALVGLSAQLRPMARISAITDATSSAGIPSADIPRFRAVNEEVIQLDIDFGYNFGGVLTTLEGKMLALWASYAKPVGAEVRDMVRGLPVAPIVDARDEVLRWRAEGTQGVGSVKLLDAEFDTMMLAKAGAYGVPPEWIDRLMAADPVRRQALTVASTVAATGASRVLEGGDVVLTAGGQAVVSFRAIEEAAAALGHTAEASSGGHAAMVNGGAPEENAAVVGAIKPQAAVAAASSALALPMTVLRKGVVVDVMAELSTESCAGTGRLLHWAGCQLQTTHRPVVELGFRPTADDGRPLDVFISRWYHGSPAQRYGLYALNWVASVNGEPTPDLDTFVAVTRGLEDGSFVRLKLISLTARPKVRYEVCSGSRAIGVKCRESVLFCIV